MCKNGDKLQFRVRNRGSVRVRDLGLRLVVRQHGTDSNNALYSHTQCIMPKMVHSASSKC